MKLSHTICSLSVLLFCLAACDSGKEVDKPAAGESPKAGQVQPGSQNSASKAAAPDAGFTDDQKFSYMLGDQFGVPVYVNYPKRIGEMLSLDAMVQGVVDAIRKDRDSTVNLQMTQAEMASIDSLYDSVARDRIAAGDKASPVKVAGPIENKPVVIDSTSSAILKYSYAAGVQVAYMFIGVERSFEQRFSLNHFVYGLREGVASVIDDSYRMSLSRDSMKVVNSRYMKKIQGIMEKRRRADIEAQSR